MFCVVFVLQPSCRFPDNTGIGQTGSFESTAVYTSPQGALLLYTDGDSIFNGQTHSLIGTGVGGDSSATEAALIVPVPGGDPTNDFYVFGNTSNIDSAMGPINFTQVDRQADTIGAITALDGGLVFSESLGIVPHANGDEFWIMSVTNATPTLNVYLVNAGGVSGTPVTSAIPSLPGGTMADRATVIYHPPTGQLAISFYHQNGTIGYIYTADFNESTGMASNFNQEVTGNLGYAVAFSPDASTIYYSVGSQGWNGSIVHRDLATDTSTTIAAGQWAAPRLGPDGRIYVADSGATVLGVVNNPDAGFASINWDASGVSIPAGSSSAYSLPNQTYAACNVNVDPEPGAVARFAVTKEYSDGNPDAITVTLTCNTGLPLEQSFEISDGNPVEFVVHDFTDGEMDCEITETGTASSYTPSFDNGSEVSSTSCSYVDVTSGSYSCAITNLADPATYTVHKQWNLDDSYENTVELVANVTIVCDSEILADDAVEAAGEWWVHRTLLGQSDSASVEVDTSDGPAECVTGETILPSSVEVQNGCGQQTELSAGEDFSCMITNTVFFEGIPTLGQYGLAIMALLMLATGLVGFRRLN
jgi:hypothetical protein